MTIKEKEIDAIKKMVAKRLSPGSTSNYHNSSSPPVSVAQILGCNLDINKVNQEFKLDDNGGACGNTVSRNNRNMKTKSQDAFT
jgi:hypothetical protein